MDERYPTLIHRWFGEVWNRGHEEVIDEMLAPDVRIHGIGDTPNADLIGPEAFKAYFRKFRRAFPGIRTTVLDIVSEETKMAARFSVDARHEGDGFGFLPTQNEVHFTGFVIVHLRNGKIAEVWNQVDFATMHHQLVARQ